MTILIQGEITRERLIEHIEYLVHRLWLSHAFGSMEPDMEEFLAKELQLIEELRSGEPKAYSLVDDMCVA